VIGSQPRDRTAIHSEIDSQQDDAVPCESPRLRYVESDGLHKGPRLAPRKYFSACVDRLFAAGDRGIPASLRPSRRPPTPARLPADRSSGTIPVDRRPRIIGGAGAVGHRGAPPLSELPRRSDRCPTFLDPRGGAVPTARAPTASVPASAYRRLASHFAASPADVPPRAPLASGVP